MSTAPNPLNVKAESKLTSSVPFFSSSKASTSVLASPISEPSKNSDQAPVPMFLIRISSSAKETPPAVPALLDPR